MYFFISLFDKYGKRAKKSYEVAFFSSSIYNNIISLRMETQMETLYIVVPCYNEEEVLPQSSLVFKEKIFSLRQKGAISDRSKVMLVDDGSKDATWNIISGLCRDSDFFCAVKLSKNRGHQNALSAGLVTAMEKADITVSIDADLQDDVNAIDKMVEARNAGAEIVCGVRSSRESDTFLKRTTARGYYAIMNLFGVKLIFDHADFRLLSREALKRLFCYGTEDLFLRGLVPRLGLEIQKVSYDRSARLAGESKYSVAKMLALASKGIGLNRIKPAPTMQIGELYIEQVINV